MDFTAFFNPYKWLELIKIFLDRPRPIIIFRHLYSNESENNYCHPRINSTFGSRKSWFFRIGIDNIGRQRIEEADVRMEKIERLQQDDYQVLSSCPFFFHWANENSDNSRSIYTNTPCFLDVVFTVDGENNFFIFHKGKHSGTGIVNTLPAGKYKFTIKLLGANIKPLEKKIIIDFNGQWDSLTMTVVDSDSDKKEDQDTIKVLDDKIKKTEDVDIIPQLSKKKLFVNSSIGLRMRSTPEIKKDNIICVLKNGDEVLILDEQEKWFKVECQNKRGWVSSFYLSEEYSRKEGVIKESAEVPQSIFQVELPKFKIGLANLANNKNTKKVRKLINDEFGGGRNNWELQCTEYVQYKIHQLGINIKWPSDRPRHGGKWASIFEKNGLYKVLNKPKAGCAMSFTSGLRNTDIGHVAFVEEVHKDGYIKISEANWPPPGKYNERPLSKSEWRDKYKGRFIDFT